MLTPGHKENEIMLDAEKAYNCQKKTACPRSICVDKKFVWGKEGEDWVI